MVLSCASSGFRDAFRLGMIGVFVWLCGADFGLRAIWDLPMSGFGVCVAMIWFWGRWDD